MIMELFKLSLRNAGLMTAGILLGFGVAHAAAPAAEAISPSDGDSPSLTALIERCAPTVHPETMSAVISAESRGHQFAIADAGPVKMPWSERKYLVQSHYMGSLDEAEAKATALIANGRTVSLGLAQINDRNLSRLGLSVRDAFEPCANLSAGGKILTEFYLRAAKEFGPGEKALRAAISAYNSGDWIRGEKEGYVDLVYQQAGKPLKLQTAPIVPKIRPNSAKGVIKNRATTSVTPSANNRAFAMSARGFSVSE